MNLENLFEALLSRKDLNDIPIEYLVRTCLAVFEELPKILKEEQHEWLL